MIFTNPLLLKPKNTNDYLMEAIYIFLIKKKPDFSGFSSNILFLNTNIYSILACKDLQLLLQYIQPGQYGEFLARPQF